MWINAPLSRYKLFASEKHAIFLAIAICVLLRAIPELVAYPHPIGYDVVNYYIPVVTNFDEHWPVTAGQFPLYVLLLHLAATVTGLAAHSVVAGTAVAVFGAFGLSLYYLGRSLLKLSINQSVFLALFAVVQMAVLRTAWDLHRDVFALTAMMFVLSILGRRDAGWKWVAVAIVLAALAVAADRMVGALLCISLAAFAVMTRRRDIIAVSILAAGLFSALIIASYAALGTGSGGIEVSVEKTPVFYNPQNLLILFAVVNGLLFAPAAIGFLRMKSGLLKIPLLVSLAGSFSWLAAPDVSLFVADRWVILAGIFLSIFAGYGILQVSKSLKPGLSIAVAGSALAAFAAIGLAYAVMPYDSPFVLFGAMRSSIEDFGPVTMQFNSLDIQDNSKLLSAIDSINRNTEQDAVIVGEKHWRGFMELHLEDGRTYRFSDNPPALALALEMQGKHAYQFRSDGGSPVMFAVEDVAIR